MYASDPFDSLVPLFTESTRGHLEQVGTGIFVEFQNEPFLLTAAHVSDLGSLFVPVLDSFAVIDGYLAFVDLPPETPREKDNADVAYCRLRSEFATLLCSNFRPWPQSRCQLMESALELGVCSIYGFPVSRAQFQRGTHSSETASFRGVAANQTVYESLQLSVETSIIIHFHRRRAVAQKTGKRTNPIHPRGLSGGGIYVWPEGRELSSDWSTPNLVGIFHTYRKGDGLMIGSQLVVVMTAIQLGRMKSFDGVT